MRVSGLGSGVLSLLPWFPFRAFKPRTLNPESFGVEGMEKLKLLQYSGLRVQGWGRHFSRTKENQMEQHEKGMETGTLDGYVILRLEGGRATTHLLRIV